MIVTITFNDITVHLRDQVICKVDVIHILTKIIQNILIEHTLLVSYAHTPSQVPVCSSAWSLMTLTAPVMSVFLN